MINQSLHDIFVPVCYVILSLLVKPRYHLLKNISFFKMYFDFVCKSYASCILVLCITKNLLSLPLYCKFSDSISILFCPLCLLRYHNPKISTALDCNNGCVALAFAEFQLFIYCPRNVYYECCKFDISTSRNSNYPPKHYLPHQI